MINPKTLEHLHNNRDFYDWMCDIKEARESNIDAMDGCATEKLQQLSGKILEADRILEEANFEGLALKWNVISS